jgi:hypothetical protein
MVRKIGEGMDQFSLKVPEEKLRAFADDYLKDKAEMERERSAFEAGERIRQRTSIDIKADLKKIVEWKSPRSVHYLEANSAEEIDAAVDPAILGPDDATKAISALMELKGVGLPVASAILTAMFPDRYTVIDFRALEALGHDQAGIEFYRKYLEFCRLLSGALAETGKLEVQADHPAPTELRVLDRALWQWSASKGKLKD